jgi:NADH-quinone oxidoreductase subunit E
LLVEKYRQEIDTILAKYPPDQQRSAVMPLLYLAQREYGYISRETMAEVGQIIGLDATEVGSLIGFYTLYHDQPGGKVHIQICTDLPCSLRGAERFAAELCEHLGIQMGETTPDGLITVEEVMCLAGCDKAPLFQVQDRSGIHYHEHQTVQSALELIDRMRQEPEDA